MTFWQSNKNFITSFKFCHLGSGVQDRARAIIADFVGKPCRNIQNEDKAEEQADSYLSLRTAFIAPAAFLTSIGLILAAWTLIKISVGRSTVREGTSPNSY